MRIRKKRLTAKQQMWAKILPEVGYNATEAAIRVYNCKDRHCARVIGTQVRRRVEQVCAEEGIRLPDTNKKKIEIDPLLSEKVTAEWVLTELLKVADKTKNDRDRLRALELVGKFRDLGMFRDHQVTEDLTDKPQSAKELTDEFTALISKQVNP